MNALLHSLLLRASRPALCFLLVAAAIAACGPLNGNSGKGKEQDGPEPAPSADAGKDAMRIGLVTDFAGAEDGSINQLAWEGLQRAAAKLGFHAEVRESVDEADYAKHLADLAKNGRQLIWGTGFLMQNALQEAAERYPAAGFAIVDGIVDAPNAVSVSFRMEEGAFLAGVIAGSMTKTGTVGFIGGIPNDEVKGYEESFRAGAAAANADAKLLVQYANSFADAKRAEQLAAKLYDHGADILFQASGASGDGLFAEAARRREAGEEAWVIGFEKDEARRFGHGVTLTSLVKRYDIAVETVTRQFVEGGLSFGAVSLGVAEERGGRPCPAQSELARGRSSDAGTLRRKVPRERAANPI